MGGYYNCFVQAPEGRLMQTRIMQSRARLYILKENSYMFIQSATSTDKHECLENSP